MLSAEITTLRFNIFIPNLVIYHFKIQYVHTKSLSVYSKYLDILLPSGPKVRKTAYFSLTLGFPIGLGANVEPLLWGHPFCIRNVAFQVGWLLIRGRNQYIFLELHYPVDFQEGLAFHRGGLSKGVPLYMINVLKSYVFFCLI